MEPQWIYRAATLIWLAVMAVYLIASYRASAEGKIEFFGPALGLAGLLATFSLALAFIFTGRIW